MKILQFPSKEDDVDDKIECFWVRTKRKANIADILVEFYFRPSSRDEEAGDIFYKQLGEVS